MRTLKKATATLLAVATTAVSFDTMYSVSANECVMSAEEAQLMNTFNEDIEKDIVRYLFENGCSISEVEDMMDRYMEGKQIREFEQRSSNSRIALNAYYYNTTKIAPVDHFVTVIVTDPTQSEETLTVNINGNSNSVTSNNYSALCYAYNSKVEMNDVFRADKWRHSTMFTDLEALTNTEATPLAKYKIFPAGNTNTEAKLYNSISMTYSAMNNDNLILAYETYARGDVNHDGEINSVDSTYLLEYLVNQNTLNFTYIDGSNHYSFATNVLAADTNLDGSVSMIDNVYLNRYLDGETDLFNS
ncbi:MAG: dockerin type I repeat-containing protein [Oscillospiraceae bacterium]|nr:dockerin type I repeat-containing protein [Oscillospiraceae bacterium]